MMVWFKRQTNSLHSSYMAHQMNELVYTQDSPQG